MENKFANAGEDFSFIVDIRLHQMVSPHSDLLSLRLFEELGFYKYTGFFVWLHQMAFPYADFVSH